MSLQYRKSKKIMPGVRLNATKSGVSVTVGGNGYHKTYGKNGVTTSVGIPGTGIYDRTYTSYDEISRKRQQQALRDAQRSKKEQSAFSKHPVLMILSICIMAFGVNCILIPELKWWLIFPSWLISTIIYIYCLNSD